MRPSEARGWCLPIQGEVSRVLAMDRREVPRYRVRGQAFWSSGRMEGACRVVDVSVLGLGISDPVPSLEPGDRMEVTLVVGEGEVLSAVRVEVVHTARGMGLAFVKPDPRLIARIEELTAELTPVTETTWIAATSSPGRSQ
jgi:hypothetical protein